MHTLNALKDLVEYHEVLAYFVIFLGVIFEGEFIVIFTGILAHLGALNFWFALPFILLGGIGKTFLGYAIGRLIYDKWCNTKLLRYINKRVYQHMPHFQTKPFWSIFLSKFIMGANHIVIIFSGFKKVKYKQFLTAEFISTAIWGPGLLALGYFFSYTALHISREIWTFTLLILIFIAIFIFLDKMLGWLYGLLEEIYGKENEQ